jgi:hypothetical protein
MKVSQQFPLWTQIKLNVMFFNNINLLILLKVLLNVGLSSNCLILHNMFIHCKWLHTTHTVYYFINFFIQYFSMYIVQYSAYVYNKRCVLQIFVMGHHTLAERSIQETDQRRTLKQFLIFCLFPLTCLYNIYLP